MPNIKIDELQPAGVEFFEGAEGYLDNLSEDENVWGGASNVVVSVDNKGGEISIDGDVSIDNKNGGISISVKK
jgi:hypothetical protein